MHYLGNIGLREDEAGCLQGPGEGRDQHQLHQVQRGILSGSETLLHTSGGQFSINVIDCIEDGLPKFLEALSLRVVDPRMLTEEGGLALVKFRLPVTNADYVKLSLFLLILHYTLKNIRSRLYYLTVLSFYAYICFLKSRR